MSWLLWRTHTRMHTHDERSVGDDDGGGGGGGGSVGDTDDDDNDCDDDDDDTHTQNCPRTAKKHRPSMSLRHRRNKNAKWLTFGGTPRDTHTHTLQQSCSVCVCNVCA